MLPRSRSGVGIAKASGARDGSISSAARILGINNGRDRKLLEVGVFSAGMHLDARYGDLAPK